MKSEKKVFKIANLTGSDATYSATVLNENGLPYYILPYSSQIAAKFSSLYSIKNDLEVALSYLNAYFTLDGETSILTQSLWTSAVIAYSKCFTDASQGRKTRLEIEDCLKNIDNSVLHIKFHYEIMEMRHKYLSHGGDSQWGNREALIFLNPELDNRYMQITGFVTHTNDIGESRVSSLHSLISLVLDCLSKKIEKIHTALKAEVLQEGDAKYWYGKVGIEI
jgi:hypothetical protein